MEFLDHNSWWFSNFLCQICNKLAFGFPIMVAMSSSQLLKQQAPSDSCQLSPLHPVTTLRQSAWQRCWLPAPYRAFRGVCQHTTPITHTRVYTHTHTHTQRVLVWKRRMAGPVARLNSTELRIDQFQPGDLACCLYVFAQLVASHSKLLCDRQE